MKFSIFSFIIDATSDYVYMTDEHLSNLPRIKTGTKKVTQIFINPSEIQSFGEQYPISSKKFYDKLKSETSKLWSFIISRNDLSKY